MMMSSDEAEALDTWASENKLRSKAEAVRQLCEIGLEAGAKADAMEIERLRLLTVKRKAARQIGGLKSRIAESPDDGERLRLLYKGLDVLSDIIGEVVECAADIANMSMRLTAPAVARRSQDEIETALYRTDWTPEGVETETEAQMRARLEAVKLLVDRQGKTPSEEST